MHDQNIIYEQPLNERMRFFLRLEFLFRHARHCLNGSSAWDSHSGITTLVDILGILGRVDIKTEVIKELDRLSDSLNSIPRTADVNHTTLDQLLTTLSSMKSQLYAKEGSIVQELKNNEFIKVLIQRGSVSGGLNDFDTPVYHYWLTRSHDQRNADLKRWLASLDTLRMSIELILKLIRESTDFSEEVATTGNYQKTLDSGSSYQLLRILLADDTSYFAEISAGKHRFTVRFMEPHSSDRPRQTSNDVSFKLACCVL